jgi:hypothetical protein
VRYAPRQKTHLITEHIKPHTTTDDIVPIDNNNGTWLFQKCLVGCTNRETTADSAEYYGVPSYDGLPGVFSVRYTPRMMQLNITHDCYAHRVLYASPNFHPSAVRLLGNDRCVNNLIIADSQCTTSIAVSPLENPSVYKPSPQGATCLNNTKLLNEHSYVH